MLRLGRTAALLVSLVAGAAFLGGCGASSDDESQTTASAKPSKQAGCSPTPARVNPRISRHLEELAAVDAKIAGADTRFEVTQSNLRASIAGHFGVKEPFTPAKGSKFLSVTYSIENEGPVALKPSKTVNESALVADSNGRAWSNEQLASCGGPVAASLAAVQEVESPNEEIAPGQEATTVVVFVVPADSDGFVLKLPNQELAFDLRPEA
ncbi:MAG TPA: hypothetical protein VJU14_13585 [Solirubrobacterales bacterium]|nr:hypothetical protein [Solirubrobacterales bacterium]